MMLELACRAAGCLTSHCLQSVMDFRFPTPTHAWAGVHSDPDLHRLAVVRHHDLIGERARVQGKEDIIVHLAGLMV